MIHLLLFWACILFLSYFSSNLMFSSTSSSLFCVWCFCYCPPKCFSFCSQIHHLRAWCMCLWFFFFLKSGWTKLLHSLKSVSETSGALDLGGASTQITFVSDESPSESPDNLLYFRLYGKDYRVYTHSFLCYGKDQALQQKLARDLQASASVVAGGGSGPLSFDMLLLLQMLLCSS